MTKLDFKGIAYDFAQANNQESLLPVIEKEIIHFEVLNSLDRQGILNLLTFQGGTCLRLCYGGVRYSEDLDFSSGNHFGEIDPVSIANALKKDVCKQFDVKVRIKNPDEHKEFGSVGVKRWWLVVDTVPARPDLPSQKMKIEVASVPSYTKDIRRVEPRYENLPLGYDTLLIPCQSREEILADKIIAFANTEGYVRYRDIWDMSWLRRRPQLQLDIVSSLVEAKHQDYSCKLDLPLLLRHGQELVQNNTVIEAFKEEMKRFIPPVDYERTVGRSDYLSLIISDVEDVYDEVRLRVELS